jgi:hypothetical protein
LGLFAACFGFIVLPVFYGDSFYLIPLSFKHH